MTFLRNAWYCAGWGIDLGAEGLSPITLLNEPVLLYRQQDGTAVAIGDRCPHRFAPLHMGKKVNDTVQCAYHGLRFDASGRCVHNPHGDGAVPKAAAVKAYPLVERHDALWIWMGDAALADATQIPDFSEAATREGWSVVHGHLNVAAHYELLTDNLMDLSHVPYLHPFLTFSGEPPEGFRFFHEMRLDGDAVWAMNRWVNRPISPLFQMLWDDAPPTAEMWADMRYHARRPPAHAGNRDHYPLLLGGVAQPQGQRPRDGQAALARHRRSLPYPGRGDGCGLPATHGHRRPHEPEAGAVGRRRACCPGAPHAG